MVVAAGHGRARGVLLLGNGPRCYNPWRRIWFSTRCWSIAFTARRQLPYGRVAIDVGILAGVYALSCLGVMALFAVGRMVLEEKRRRLPVPLGRGDRATSCMFIGTAGDRFPHCIAELGGVRLVI